MLPYPKFEELHECAQKFHFILKLVVEGPGKVILRTDLFKKVEMRDPWFWYDLENSSVSR